MLELVYGVLIISLIGAALALLLEVANRYIANYGEVHVLINEEKDLTVQGGSPLLFTLGEQGIFVPSACGGKGTCAYCKLQVLDGGGPVLPTETPFLSPDELKNDVRLSCQVKVRNDIRIQIPEELFLVKEFRARVDHMEDVTPRIKELRFILLEPEEGITFKPGQYIQLEVPKFELTKGPEFRAFSIASSQEDPHKLQLVITAAPEGVVAVYVHNHLKEGDEVVIRGPYGDFYLRDSDREILMIATGSGMAPIKSILHQVQKEGINRPIKYFFGGRQPEDLYYVEWLRELETELPDFKFYPVLSRVKEEDQWTGDRGRVTDLIKKYIPDNAAMDVYICGAPPVVESSIKSLVDKGIPEESIYYDKFA